MNSSLRFALRSLRRTPGFTTLAIAILTLGIGATTAMFSITDTVLFKPLAYRDPGQLAALSLTFPAFANVANRIPFNGSHYRFFQQHSRTLAGIALVGPSRFVLSGSGQAIAVQGVRVTPNFFSVLGVQPRLGRGFLPQEGDSGKNHVVILSNAFWHAKFNANPHILGRKITLDGTPYQVIGITAPDFPFPRGQQLSDIEPLPENIQYWTPLSLSPDDFARADGHMRYLSVVRLKPNVSFAQAYADLNALESVISKQFSWPQEVHPILQPLRASLARNVREPLLLLLGAVALVLLIVCINLMNLMLVRAAARRREWAIRLAVGAGLRQMIRDALAESVLLAFAGGMLGSIIAAWLLALVRATAPFDLPRVDELHINLGAFAFALGASVFSAVLFGLWPAWRGTKIDPQEALQSSSRTTTEGRKGHRLGRILVGAEVALSVVVLLCAGLLIHSFVRILQVNPGVQVQHVTTADIQLSPKQYKTAAQTTNFYQQVVDGLRALPQVKQAGVTTVLALTVSDANSSMYAADRPVPPITQWPMTTRIWTDRSYFDASGTPLMAGRLFQRNDGEQRIAVISENLAARLWPHESAIGHLIGDSPGNKPYRIIGVVGSVHVSSLTKRAENTVYLPYWHEPNTGMSLVIRTIGDPRNIDNAIRRTVAELDPQAAVSNIQPMQDLVDDSVAQRRFQLCILVAFAGMALILACLGIYGVLSFNVGRRTGEIGIRMALGARPAQILVAMLRQGMVPVIAGLVMGVALSAALGRMVQSLLFGVEALDPATYLVTSFTLLGVAFLACFVPARRAARLNPLEALRNE